MADAPKRTAWIACYDGKERGVRWFGHIATEEGVLEHGPEWASPEDAMIWARERSSSIFVRLREDGRYWWAGKGAPPPTPPTEGHIAWFEGNSERSAEKHGH